MAGGLTVSVRQIASYPSVGTPAFGDLILLQQGGLGGPYGTVNAATLVANTLNQPGGPALGVGTTPPAGAGGNQIFSDAFILPFEGGIGWNSYDSASGQGPFYSGNGPAAGIVFVEPNGWTFNLSPVGEAGAPVVATQTLMQLTLAGNLRLPFGTLSVARDPGSALEVATAGWVGANTVASFNGRRGVVTLGCADIEAAIGMPLECLATIPQVNQIVCTAIQDLIRTYPAVWSWNGRVGDVWLTLDDINWALAQGGVPPISPEPPADSNDGSIATTEWVRQTIAAILAGPPAYATQDWVEAQLAALNVGVSSWNGRQGAVTLTLTDILTAGGAPGVSPNFFGVPTAPTAPPGTASAQLATTAFVEAAVTAATTGVVSFNTRTGPVTLEAADLSGVGGALLASPNFTGTPTGPTPPVGDSSQRFATTAFVETAIAAATAGVSSWNGRFGAVTLLLADVTAVGGAPISSPSFSGTPTAPTAVNGTNTTQLATTAFVQNELTAISAGVISFNGRSGAVTFTSNDLSAVNGATLASPAFTGTPTAPTAAPGTSSTQIATTAFVANAIQGAAVTSFNGRSGTVTLTAADINSAGGALIASPAFTGNPTAPTPTAGNSSTAIATTAFVMGALAGYLPLTGGVMTGPLSLAGNATQPLNAVPLSQVQGLVAAAPFVPLSGGTMTGTLTNTQGIVAQSYTVSGSNNLFNLLRDGSGNPLVNWTTGWYDTFNLANGTRQMIGGGNVLWTLGSTGNVTVAGAITAPGGVIGGALSMTAAGQPNNIQGNLSVGGTLGVTGTSNINALNATSGQFTGNLGCNGTLGNIGPAGSSFALQNTGTWMQVIYSAGWAFQWTIANGIWVWLGGNTQLATLDSAGNMHLAGSLSQGSDAAGKTNIAPISQGLSLIKQLVPKSFNRLPGTLPDGTPGPAPPTQWGFIAQDVEPVIPQAVQGTGGGTLSLDVTAILAACVYCLQQCAERLAALESAANVTPSAAQTA